MKIRWRGRTYNVRSYLNRDGTMFHVNQFSCFDTEWAIDRMVENAYTDPFREDVLGYYTVGCTYPAL